MAAMEEQFAARMAANIRSRLEQQPKRTKRTRVTLTEQTLTTAATGIELVFTPGQGGTAAIQLRAISSIPAGIEVEEMPKNVMPLGVDLLSGDHAEDVVCTRMQNKKCSFLKFPCSENHIVEIL